MTRRICEVCGLQSIRTDGHKRFFMAQFPKDETRCKQWVKVVGKEDLAFVPIEVLNRSKFVCGKHFNEKSFHKKKTRLKKNAIPSLFLPAPPLAEHLLLQFPLHVHDSILNKKKECMRKKGTTVTFPDLNEIEDKENLFYEQNIPISDMVEIITHSDPVASSSKDRDKYENRSEECTVSGTTFPDLNEIEDKENLFYEQNIPISDMVEIITHSNPDCTNQKQTPKMVPKNKRRKNILRKKLNQFKKKMEVLKRINSPALLLLTKQIIANQNKPPRGRRWSNEMKGLILAIYKKSPKVYRYLKQLMPLPSESTLLAILQKVPMEPGINDLVFNYLTKKSLIMKNDKEKLCVLIFDEMSLKKRLIYNSHSDKVEGFQDLGSHGRTFNIPDKTLVFMLQGIYKKFKQPLGHYFLKGTISSEKLVVLIKEAIKKVSETGFQVIATVCDQGPTNVGGLNLLKKFSGLPLEENYFLVNEHKVFILYDVPHLFKNIRNNFMQAGQLKYNGMIARWSHIQELLEKNITTLHFRKITPLHIAPTYRAKMKVKLAAQILSNTVKAILILMAEKCDKDEKEYDGRLKHDAIMQTANVIKELDQLFDCTNGPASKKDIIKGYRENVYKTSFHHNLWLEYKRKIKTLTFLKSDSRIHLSNIRCVKGYNITLCSLQDIWKLVNDRGFKYLNLRQLNQDSLENLFGVIRQHCPTNSNPTCHHFTAALKSTILTRLNTPVRGSNCETDENVLMLDFHEVVFNNLETQDSLDDHQYATSYSEEAIEIDYPVINLRDNEGPANKDTQKFHAFEQQPLIYVSGYIAKNLLNHIRSNCTKCINTIRVKTPENKEIYKYINLKDRKEGIGGNNSLTYPTIQLCSAVEAAVKIFEAEIQPCLHRTDIGNYYRTLMFASIDSSWLCEIHKNDVFAHLLQCIANLLIRNECKKINQLINENEQSCADYMKKAQVLGIRK